MCVFEFFNSPDPVCFKLWKERLPYMDNDYHFVEPILALRSTILNCLLCRQLQLQTQTLEVQVESCEEMEVERGGGEGRGEEGGRGVSLASRRRTESLYRALSDTLLLQAQSARKAKRHQVAEGALFTLRHLEGRREEAGVPEVLCSAAAWRRQLEEGELSWQRGERSFAMQKMRALLQRLSTVRARGGGGEGRGGKITAAWLLDIF